MVVVTEGLGCSRQSGKRDGLVALCLEIFRNATGLFYWKEWELCWFVLMDWRHDG